MPGAGKSTLGVVLAKMLNYDFLDADLVIQKHCNKTLQRIIDSEGSEAFIRIENEVLACLSASRTIVSTGGSAVYSAEAMEYLSGLGTVVYLRVSFEEMLARLHDLHERGIVLPGGGSLKDLYEERKPLYERYADVTVDVDGLTITLAARKVAAALV